MVYGAADTSPGTGRLGLDKRSAKVPSLSRAENCQGRLTHRDTSTRSLLSYIYLRSLFTLNKSRSDYLFFPV